MSARLLPGSDKRGVDKSLQSDLMTFKNIRFCKKETEAFCPLTVFLVPDLQMG